jgi:predicted CXXCH cytochrome family protein
MTVSAVHGRSVSWARRVAACEGMHAACLHQRLRTVALVAISAMLCASQAAMSQAPTTRPAPTTTTRPYAANPHWRADGCRYCHEMEGTKAKLIPLERVDAICLDCHDGVRGRRERHPMGRLFVAGQVVQPGGWPVLEGKLICSTCHVHLVACRLEARQNRTNPDFIREYSGGSLLAFCGRCHMEPEYHRYKLHEMITKDGKLIKDKCLFCHTESIDGREHMVRTGNAELRTDVITLCESCHMEHVDYFEPGHVGTKVKPEMKAFMAAFEAQGTVPGRYPTREQIAEALRSKREPGRLPLAPGDKVVCSTCHNPHQEGVFPRGSVLAYGAMTPEEMRRQLHLRGLGKEICVACHYK